MERASGFSDGARVSPCQWKGKPLEGDLEVSICLYFGTKRRADLDNFNKLSLDALTIERAYDSARPRIEILVSEI